MNALDFPSWLQDQLDAKEWRSTDLARRAKISDAAVSRILRGERKADHETLKAFAKALDISPLIILRRAGVVPPDIDIMEEFLYKMAAKVCTNMAANSYAAYAKIQPQMYFDEWKARTPFASRAPSQLQLED